MSYHSRKTSFEAPARDKRKIDQEPARVPPHKKERLYQLDVVTRTVTERRERFSYPSRASREQKKAAMLKTERAQRHFGNWERGNRSSVSTTTLEFEETDVSNP